MDLAPVRMLRFPKDSFVVCGSGPMAIRGIRKSTDIDIFVSKKIWDGLSSTYPLGPLGQFCTGPIEIWKTMGDIPFEEALAAADDFGGVKFVSLDHTIRFKRQLADDKNLDDIRLIEEHRARNAP